MEIVNCSKISLFAQIWKLVMPNLNRRCMHASFKIWLCHIQKHAHKILNSMTFCPFLWNQKIHSYADDTTLYFDHDDGDCIQQTLNTDIKTIVHWCHAHHLTLNIKKSKFIFLCKPHLSSNPIYCPLITLFDAPITKTSEFKLLGLVVDDALSWKPHLTRIISKISRNLNLLRLLRHLLDFNTSLLFYYNFIHPHIIAGLVLYYFSCPFSIPTLFSCCRNVQHASFALLGSPIE